MLKILFFIFCYISVTQCFFHSLPNLNIVANQKYQKSIDMRNNPLEHIYQKVDHFDSTDSRTFQMIYSTQDEYFVPNGPIFITTTSAAAAPWELQSSNMRDLAAEFGAHLVATEVRFTGYSWPSMNLTMDYLQYNTYEQILEDIAQIVRLLKNQERFSQSKVIVFGCGMYGNIATWMRLKYPDLIDGAVASSAPVNIKPDFSEYPGDLMELIANQGGQECSDTIHKGFLEALDLVESNNVSRFSDAFMLCTPQSFDHEDITTFFLGYYAAYAQVLLYDGCHIMHNAPGTPLDKMVKFLKDIFFPLDECLQSVEFQELVDGINLDTHQSLVARALYYFQCTQLGLFTVSDSRDVLFGDSIPLSYYTDYVCPKAVDESIDAESMIASLNEINQKYGGLTPNATKVISVHGGISPLRLIGITEDLNPESPAIVISGEDSCRDYFGSNANESVEVRLAKQRIKDQIEAWLQQ